MKSKRENFIHLSFPPLLTTLHSRYTFSKKRSSDFLAARLTVDLNSPSLTPSVLTAEMSSLVVVAMTELWGTRVKGTPLIFLGPVRKEREREKEKFNEYQYLSGDVVVLCCFCVLFVGCMLKTCDICGLSVVMKMVK